MGRLIIFIGLLLVLLSGFVASAAAAPVDTALLKHKCTDCHDLDLILKKQAYTAEWEEILDRMVKYDSGEISQVDKLMVLKFIRENLALDGPGAKARRGQK
ncbi:MAG: hypothetical protein JXR80_06390 [Deltaproteobacteria bacterium]|nr:hypothetical protein [Deltaproteobacteria bacterium]